MTHPAGYNPSSSGGRRGSSSATSGIMVFIYIIIVIIMIGYTIYNMTRPVVTYPPNAQFIIEYATQLNTILTSNLGRTILS